MSSRPKAAGQPSPADCGREGPTGSSEDFYDALAPVFDVMTDWPSRLALEGPFLRHTLEEAEARRVLDAACGSGGHVVWLAEAGFQVAGVDESGRMVSLAAAKAAKHGVSASLAVSSLLRVSPRSVPAIAAETGGWQDFDAVLCLGNSLPHLRTLDELVGALGALASVLKPGGVIVLQNLNYDARWRSRPRWLRAQGGRLDGRDLLVWRFADYDLPPGMISFHMALFRETEPAEAAPDAGPSGSGRGARPSSGARSEPVDMKGLARRDWSVEVHTTLQRPLFEADLLAALEATGFEGARSYGSMSLPLEPFDPAASTDLVVVAHRAIDDAAVSRRRRAVR